MAIKIALAGNPNCGKTTLYNSLTGSNQFVGNWPGVTVEKKEGTSKTDKDVIITDLPGIYSLSPYTLEEVVARNYLLDEKPDAILNIVDGSNLERNLYLTTQLCELGIPVVIAINMMDIVEKNGDKLDFDALSRAMGCPVVAVSAIKNEGVDEAVKLATDAAKAKNFKPVHRFGTKVERYLKQVEVNLPDTIPQSQRKFYAIKLFERDHKISLSVKNLPDVSDIIAKAEKEMDDDAESIITNERYEYITSIIGTCYKRKNNIKSTTSDKIDAVITNRFAALPIFAVIMFLVYYISVSTVGGWATDWANDGVFGDGWHLFGIGSSEYQKVYDEYNKAEQTVNGFIFYASQNGIDTEYVKRALNEESADFDEQKAKEALYKFRDNFDTETKAKFRVEDQETLETREVTADYKHLIYAVSVYEKYNFKKPLPKNYGIWIPGVPTILGNALDSVNCAAWLKGLILNGIVAGVGAVLGFVPQMLVLFLFLAFLEACGYMSRIAFIMDRIFRKFGLSGKSFIPILIGTGCGVPGIMASRTIENKSDRRMTIITTTFIPCGAKLPTIAMFAGAVFGGAAWVAPSAYFVGIFAIICSGIILKKTRIFKSDVSPFVMELPAYHMPTFANVMRSMWERGSEFIQKAGTVILLSSVIVWFASYFGFVNGEFGMLDETQLDKSILAIIGRSVSWIFVPLGWGNWQSTVATVTGLLAKENIVSTLGILYKSTNTPLYSTIAGAFTAVSAYSFLVFNLLCAPCFAAMAAIRREMNSRAWFWFAISYQCIFAYLASFVINHIGNLFLGTSVSIVPTVLAFMIIAVFVYMLARRPKKTRNIS